MADFIVPTITLAPRARKGPETVTVTATATSEVTVFVTDEVTVSITKTIETTTSIFDTSFIHVTTTVTNNSTTTKPTTVTETQTLAPKTAHPTVVSLLPTPVCPTPSAQHALGKKHIDPFQVLSIVFGVSILFLTALMLFLVRRFYKMYRAERVLRKQMQTEGTELPPMRMAVNEHETHVVGEE